MDQSSLGQDKGMRFHDTEESGAMQNTKTEYLKNT